MPSLTTRDVQGIARSVHRLPTVHNKPIRAEGDVVRIPRPRINESEADFALPIPAIPLPIPGMKFQRSSGRVQCFGSGECAEIMPELSTLPLAKRKPESTRDVGDFGHATDHIEAQLTEYRGMTQEERAEWVYAKTTAEYVPPFAKVEPRRWWNADGTRATR